MLKRIEGDEFGWCAETGEMIGVGGYSSVQRRHSASKRKSAVRTRRLVIGADMYKFTYEAV